MRGDSWQTFQTVCCYSPFQRWRQSRCNHRLTFFCCSVFDGRDVRRNLCMEAEGSTSVNTDVPLPVIEVVVLVDASLYGSLRQAAGV